jgi:hypothetical protein
VVWRLRSALARLSAQTWLAHSAVLGQQQTWLMYQLITPMLGLVLAPKLALAVSPPVRLAAWLAQRAWRRL